MTEAQKKGLVLTLAALVFVPIVAWRSWRAAQSAETGEEWSQYIKEERLAEAPSWYRPSEVFTIHRVPEGPHLRLATLRFQQNREYVTTSLASNPNLNFPPLYARALAMRANAYLNESIDDQAPGLAEGTAELVQAIYLFHAGKVPDDVRAESHQLLCQATDILPDTAAEEAGMRAGDDFIEIGGASVTQAEPCLEVIKRLKAPGGTRVPLTMLRDGARIELELVKRSGVDGFRYSVVPILDSQ